MKCSVKSGRIVAHKDTQVFFFTWQLENKLFKASVLWMNDRMTPLTEPLNSASVTDLALHSTHRKGHQSKLLVVHPNSWNFLGLLHCDDRISPWWVSRDGPQLDRTRSDTGMISKNFNSYASLAIFFIISVFFCFVFEHGTLYTIRVLAVFDFLTVRKLAI